jgi:undecaprenyl-diphosphatase
MSAAESLEPSRPLADVAALGEDARVKFSRLARLLALDEKLLRRLVKSRRVRVAFVLRVLCRMVDPDMVIMGILIALFSPPLVGVADRAAVALSLVSILVVIVKRTVRRTRPALDIQGIVPPDRFSFPSGHTAAAFALAISMFGVIPWIVPPLLFLACAVAYGRMYLGVHYPLDVAAGAALGLLTGSLVALIDIPQRVLWTMPF